MALHQFVELNQKFWNIKIYIQHQKKYNQNVLFGLNKSLCFSRLMIRQCR